MASPRVFISSTFYDLRHVRNDLDRFVRDLGYEPVLFEQGAVTYGGDSNLEDYCYREIELCDILVSIVGSRYGTKSQKDGDSISQKELRTALRRGKQVYIFVEKPILNEFRTWELNRERSDIKYASVDNIKIFEFLAELYALPNNNQITGFENAGEICLYLQRQWAGLFQRFLSTNNRAEEVRSIEKLNASVSTLDRLVDLLTEHQQSRSDIVDAILLIEHPVFSAVKRKLRLPMRVAFYTTSELEDLMKAYRFSDYEDVGSSDYLQWVRDFRPVGSKVAGKQYVMVSRELFTDDGNLKPMNPGEWQEDYFQVNLVEPDPVAVDDDDDLPF